MPSYTFRESELPEGVTCVDLEARWGLRRGDVARMTTAKGVVTVETLVEVAIPAPEPPIIGVMDAVLKRTRVPGEGLSDAERAAIQKALAPGA